MQTSDSQHNPPTPPEEEPLYDNDAYKIKIFKDCDPLRCTNDEEDQAITKFAGEVAIVILACNKNEYYASLELMKAPELTKPDGQQLFERAVRFPNKDNMIIATGVFAGHKAAIAWIEQGASCERDVRKLLSWFPNTKALLGVGVAYGMSRNATKFCDVLVASQIVDYGDRPRVEHGGFYQRGAIVPTKTTLRNIFCKDDTGWEFSCTKTDRKAKVVVDRLASGSFLLDDASVKKSIQEQFKDAKGGEMEGWILYTHIVEDYPNLEVIIIKGVSDYADGNKDGRWQLTAAMAAASYTHFQLKRCTPFHESNPPNSLRPQEIETDLSAIKMMAKDQEVTDSSIRRCNVIFPLIILIALIAFSATIWYSQLYQPVTDSVKNYTQYRPTQYVQYVDKVKQRYKTHLRDVAQSFWLPTNMHTFIQLSLTSRDKPHIRIVHRYSANPRIVSDRSMTFDHLLSEIDASPGSRILVVGQPGIGKTTLLQMITRSWAHDKALSSCWILLHIVLRDLVLLQHSPNLTTFLSFMGSIKLPPDIETFVLESDGRGLCFIADGLNEYPAGYEDKTNFIFSELIGGQKLNLKLAQSTVVISSRPEITSQLWDMFNKSVEVLGFSNDQINAYIQAKYGEDKSFSRYLDDHPHIKHTCYIPLHLTMLVYLKDYLHDMPETETEIYEQFIFHTLIRDFCKDPTSSCSRKNTLDTSLKYINKSLEVGSLLFHIAKLSYNGILNRQSIFTVVEPVLQHKKNSSLLVVDKMSVVHPTTYTFPHLTIQEFLAAFYFNTYLSQQEQKRVFVEYSKQQTRDVFWKFCCGLKRIENKTTFLEFFNLLYQYNPASTTLYQPLPYHCAHEAQSLIASQQLINFTGGIVELDLYSYYDAASFAFVAVSAAENLQEIKISSLKFSRFFMHKLCDPHTVYYQLRKVELHIDLSSIGCLLQKSPNLESLTVSGWDWTEDAAALVLPPYGTELLNIRNIDLNGLNIGDKGVKKLSRLLQDSISLETLSLKGNSISDNGASAVADLMKALPHLRHVDLSANHIGGRGAASLWNQSIHKCCNLSLNWNIIDNDRTDAFISVLNGTVNSGYEGNKSCQLQVRVFHNEFLCSDLRDIRNISKQLPKGVMLIIANDYSCLTMSARIFKRLKYYLGKNHPPIKAGFQWIFYVVCTFQIFYSTRTPLWGLLYFCCCLSLFILSSFNYLVQVDYFIFILSLQWSFIVVGMVVVGLIHCVSLKLLPKPWGQVLFTIIAVMVQLYFFYLNFFECAFMYIYLILGNVLFRLVLFPLWYRLVICCSKFYDRLCYYVGYEFFMEVLKIGLNC